MIIPLRYINTYNGVWKDIIKTLLKGTLKEGKYQELFEQKFASYLGVKHAVSVCSGRNGLSLILISLSLPKNSEVILPAYTDESVPAVITRLKLKPVFVDINKIDFNINPALIEEKITKQTKVIIATHIFGTPCNLRKILEIAGKYNLSVIEDAAHALGAKYNDQPVGSFGEAAFFSFSMIKSINTFGGGMVVTNNNILAEKIRAEIKKYPYPSSFKILKSAIIFFLLNFLTKPVIFRLTLWLPACFLSLFGFELTRWAGKIKNIWRVATGETKFTNLQSLVGLKQLADLDENNYRIISNAALLKKNIPHLNTLGNESESKSVFYSFVLKTKSIKKISRYLLLRGVETTFSLMNHCPSLYKIKGDYPVTAQAVQTGLQVPVYSSLTSNHMLYLADLLTRNRLM